MYKIYYPGDIHDDLVGDYQTIWLPFTIEKEYWKKTSSLQEAEIVLIMGHGLYEDEEYNKFLNIYRQVGLAAHHKLLLLNITHLEQTFPDKLSYSKLREKLSKDIPNKFVIVHTNQANQTEIVYDFMFNRQKAFMFDYGYLDLNSSYAYVRHTNYSNFQLPKIIKKQTVTKKFLCPNRIEYFNLDHPRIQYRVKLKKVLEKYKKEGLISDPYNGVFFETDNEFVNNIQKKDNLRGWYPIANKFYNDTGFSVFCETLIGDLNDRDKYKSISEKTYDPLCKGHFILPFGYQGLIQNLKDLGFQFPDFIDYNYDSIENNNQRFKEFTKSLVKLLNYTNVELTEFYNNNLELLTHNRNVIKDRPYDPLYSKVKAFFGD
jgi:hypothetical protein